jgi:hypothetical protein
MHTVQHQRAFASDMLRPLPTMPTPVSGGPAFLMNWSQAKFASSFQRTSSYSQLTTYEVVGGCSDENISSKVRAICSVTNRAASRQLEYLAVADFAVCRVCTRVVSRVGGSAILLLAPRVGYRKCQRCVPLPLAVFCCTPLLHCSLATKSQAPCTPPHVRFPVCIRCVCSTCALSKQACCERGCAPKPVAYCVAPLQLLLASLQPLTACGCRPMRTRRPRWMTRSIHHCITKSLSIRCVHARPVLHLMQKIG